MLVQRTTIRGQRVAIHMYLEVRHAKAEFYMSYNPYEPPPRMVDGIYPVNGEGTIVPASYTLPYNWFPIIIKED